MVVGTLNSRSALENFPFASKTLFGITFPNNDFFIDFTILSISRFWNGKLLRFTPFFRSSMARRLLFLAKGTPLLFHGVVPELTTLWSLLVFSLPPKRPQLIYKVKIIYNISYRILCNEVENMTTYCSFYVVRKEKAQQKYLAKLELLDL